MNTASTASAPAAAMAATQRSRSPDSAIMPNVISSSRMITPRAGSRSTSATGISARASTPAACFGPGTRPLSRSSPKTTAMTRTSPILANSEGSTWKPAGRLIQALAPLTVVPSGLSTATSPSTATA